MPKDHQVIPIQKGAKLKKIVFPSLKLVYGKRGFLNPVKIVTILIIIYMCTVFIQHLVFKSQNTNIFVYYGIITNNKMQLGCMSATLVACVT